MKLKKRLYHLLFALAGLLVVTGVIQQPQLTNASLNHISKIAYWKKTSHNAQKTLPPTQEQANSVLTPAVRQQLGTSITWNKAGVYYQ